MSGDAVVRSDQVMLIPDSEPDAEPTTHALKCAVCNHTSVCSEDFADPQAWVLAHALEFPSHRTFREVIVRSWRTRRLA